MDLRWWPVAALGSAALVAAVLLAALLPMTAARRRLRPLANVARLTRLPEYARMARLRSLSTVVTLVVLAVMFGAATWAAARPTQADRDFQAAHPEDIMLCVGQPVGDAATAELLNYFARQATSVDTGERMGLTSANRRVVPLTRDLQYAASQFGDFAHGGAAQAASFEPPVPYLDYAGSVNDILALCLSGFPSADERGAHRRSVIYVGPSDRRAADEQRAALFSDDRVRMLAERGAVRVDAIDTAPSSASSALRALTAQTGGRYVNAGPGSVADALRTIRADPPPVRRADGTIATADFLDAPTIPLAIAMVSAAVLSVALLLLRR
jgi:hypothetical protein